MKGRAISKKEKETKGLCFTDVPPRIEKIHQRQADYEERLDEECARLGKTRTSYGLTVLHKVRPPPR